MPTDTQTRIADGTQLHFGEHTFTFGKEAVELEDSSPILDDTEALRERMLREGYLLSAAFTRAIWPARLRAERLSRFERLAISRPVPFRKKGSAVRANAVTFLPRREDVAFQRSTRCRRRSAHVWIFRRFLGGPVLTFDKRWLRAMASGGHNHFHYDSAYVGRGTLNRYTMWTALTDIDLEKVRWSSV